MTRREGLLVAGALLFGAALAFPAGVWVAGGSDTNAPRRGPQDAARRDVFSPSVRDDPYFLARQRENVAALEEHCRRTGEICAEARAARLRLEELGGGD